ncbi:hypothetical protein MIND_00490100 [Mycena indigotica]|uniref:Elongator complex protein 5 n=1 Tax=Mycena indigotica TaxID=2126181 RepID=A0A8H6SW25_9AGAR|nr:uncharacterized protein MIND_00490100 [Mycena indigotica]KAF7306973.1 hypothetical protein MIND_00490100 [Mycena indigotica]
MDRRFTFRNAEAADERLVQFMVAKERLASLAAANKRTYINPLFLAVWFGLSYLFVDYLQWWPDFRYGAIALLRPVPAFASIFMPLIYIVDWLNRPSFEQLGREAVHAPDVQDFAAYYARNPASGFWILKMDDSFVGLIAIDAADAKATKIARIRHFFVQDPYPSSGVHKDLLKHALNHCFAASQVEQIEATDISLASYASKALKDAGFVQQKELKTVGLLRWKITSYPKMSFIYKPQRSNQPFVLLQSSIAQSSLGILRQILEDGTDNAILFCLLYSPLTSIQRSGVEIHDLAGNVPGYSPNYQDPRETILESVKNAPSGQLDVIIDSIDTLCSDIGSVSLTYKLLREILTLVRARPDPSRLIVHAVAPSPLVALICQPAFSPALTHAISHPPALLIHLATEYLTPPPPLSPDPKFWGIFRPVSERVADTERIVFGANGEGSSNNNDFVLEVITRGDGDRRRGVERTIQGWSRLRGALPLETLPALTSLMSKTTNETASADPTENISFNLNLTVSQQNSKARVPLPYAHHEKSSPAIYYDPDSADDIDDDDPDEDLDI